MTDPSPSTSDRTSPATTENEQGSPAMRAALHAFQTSRSPFKILHTVRTATPPHSPTASPRTLAILDASYNPPTKAHLSLATSAFAASARSHAAPPFAAAPTHLLLLLSIRNADKAPAPAAHAARLDMLAAFAADAAPALGAAGAQAIDVGVTRAPLFGDKSAAIAEAAAYPGAVHLHLVGQDTFVRVLDARYYGDEGLGALRGLFDRHGLQVTLRGDESVEEQLEVWRSLERGEREADGARREWAARVQVVDGKEDARGVSSTKAREAVRAQDWDALSRLCTPGVVQYIRDNNPYDD